jgi:predicted esterase
MRIVSRVTALVMLLAAMMPTALRAQDDVADIVSQDLRIGKDENKRYFLIGPAKDAKAPDEGIGLIVVMPGNDGSAAFHPFVKRIFKNSLPPTYLVAQPVAVKWTPNQPIVWPTAKNRAESMKFTTEELVAAVIADAGARHKLNPKRIFTLTWSSSGPAAYAIALTDKQVTGSFIAMSVFKPNELPPLEKAKGHAFFLYHSPNDRVCPFRMAEQAVKDLEKNGAAVTLKQYDGGHGWRGGLYEHIADGIQWLEKKSGERGPQ